VEKTSPLELAACAVQKSNRTSQFRKRNPLPIPLKNERIFFQQLKLIHENLVRDKWNFCELQED
jgi:putative transposase